MPLVESFSGIRGIYDDGLDTQVVIRYAYCYLSFLKDRYGSNIKITIGTDTRPSKDIIKNAVMEIMDCEIIDLGIASTPMVEFAVRNYEAHGGIIITASHNEPYWNGFKFLDDSGAVLNPKDMDEIIKHYNKIKKLSNEEFSKKLFKDKRNVTNKYEDIKNEYSDYVLGFISKQDKSKIRNSNLKILIDPNGGTGIVAKQILEGLGVKIKGINMKYGFFNRPVEPNEDSLFYLANEVRDKNYDFAAGFDCDADRVEVMTSKGLVSGNHLLALIADDILKNSDNKTIVVNDATSSMVKEIAKKHNAEYLETAVGETNVVNRMNELKAPIGGEGSSSGVIIAPSRCRDGILTLLFLIKIIANKDKKIEELVSELPQYHNIKEKITINFKKYTHLRNKLKKYYKKKDYKIEDNKESLKILLNDNSYVWFRTSKTEAGLLRVIADAPEKIQAEEIIKEALKIIKD